MRTDEQKVHALKGFAKLHSGEAVEVDPNRATWHLIRVPPGSASRGGALEVGDGRGVEQWYCLPQGKGLFSLGEQERDDAFREYGATQIPVVTDMRLEVQRVSRTSGIAIGDSKPLWSA